jgi:transcriptional regulator with XRE-family HTH domain
VIIELRADKSKTGISSPATSSEDSYQGNFDSNLKISSVKMLKFLMSEHGLGQSDLPEIGSQSLVSKILNGERQLTLEHVRNLSKRFGYRQPYSFSEILIVVSQFLRSKNHMTYSPQTHLGCQAIKLLKKQIDCY